MASAIAIRPAIGVISTGSVFLSKFLRIQCARLFKIRLLNRFILRAEETAVGPVVQEISERIFAVRHVGARVEDMLVPESIHVAHRNDSLARKFCGEF